jgi:primosomal protein N' (replication factor Y)
VGGERSPAEGRDGNGGTRGIEGTRGTGGSDGTQDTSGLGDTEGSEQLALIRARLSGARRSAREGDTEPATAAVDPVARVLVDTGLPHLDRPFDYTVPASLAAQAQPGVRVKVRFAGRDLSGFVVERRAAPDHEGPLAPLRKVVSAEPVLTPDLLTLAREVAMRYAGTLGDVLRLAIPPRHAAAEKALAPVASTPALTPQPPGAAWAAYPAGAPFLSRVASGEAPAASWLAAPSAGDPAHDWPQGLAEAAQAALAGGRGALLVVPDHRDVARVHAALTAQLGADQHVRLTADQGPQARYTAWLKVLRGHVQVVVGTRAAAFAPVRSLGLVAWWDDGDDLLAEPRAPYPHVREVLLARARNEGAALLSGGFSRTTDVARLVEEGLLKPIAATQESVRRVAPRVQVAGEGSEPERDPAASSARLPSLAWRTARQALESGPVLVQVPRRGYLPALACQSCRRPARCQHCHGPLARAGAGGEPACRWCGRAAEDWACPHCDGTELRSSVVGARRTAEELGRAFPGVPVHTSRAGQVLDRVAGTPALVIATPGAEPVAEGGYAAVLLLDAWALLDRPVLTAGEESLRRWLAASALCRGAAEEGSVVLCGSTSHRTVPAVEALVRWEPAWFGERELAERRELRLPPTVRMAALAGPRPALKGALADLSPPRSVRILGPLPVEGEAHRMLLSVPLTDGPELARRLTALRATRSAHKEAAAIAIRMDPPDFGA